MSLDVGSRFRNAWNAFRNRDPTPQYKYGGMTYSRPDRPRLSLGNERSIITAVYNRIAMDVANVDIRHCMTDENGYFSAVRKSHLNDCLTLEANIDQTSRAFMQDVVLSMFDEGHVAIVATDTTADPRYTDNYDVLSLRTGRIVTWFPDKVKVNVYNEKSGKREDIILPKRAVAIVENPFFAVMNEPNSTYKRLIRKLTLLDTVDEQTALGKLDMIIQLPYVIKTQARKDQAEERRKAIENQLNGSRYGIAYTDGTEKITQLNRPLENNLMKQIEYLTALMFSQLGISEDVMNGTADEKTMLNYTNRTVASIVTAIIDPMRRTFISKTARTQGQSIEYFSDPFRLVPVQNMADIADKFIRNEIVSANEMRRILGLMPSDDPRADELRNPNMPVEEQVEMPVDSEEAPTSEGISGDTPVSQLLGKG